MEKKLEQDYNQFGDFFEQNDLLGGAEEFKKRIENYESGAVDKDAVPNRLDYISATLLYCRFQLLRGNNGEVKLRLGYLEQEHEAFIRQHFRLNSKFLHNWGELYFYDGDYTKTIQNAGSAIALKRDSGLFQSQDWQKVSLGQSLVVAGKGYYKQSDYFSALLCYYEAFINYQEAFNNQHDYLIGRVLTLIAEVFIRLNQYGKAKKLLDRAQNLFGTLPKTHIYMVGAMFLQAKCQYKEHDGDNYLQWKDLMNEVIELLGTSFKNREHRYVANVYNLKARWFLKQEARSKQNQLSPELILSQFTEELDIRRKLQGSAKTKLSATYNQISKRCFEHGSYQQAAYYTQVSIQVLIPEIGSNLDYNPTLAQIQEVQDLIYLHEALFYKARALFAYYKHHPDTNYEYLEKAQASAEVARGVIRHMRVKLPTDEAKLELSKHVRETFELYVEIAYNHLNYLKAKEQTLSEPISAKNIFESPELQKTRHRINQLHQELFKLLPDCHATYLLECILQPHAKQKLEWLYDDHQNANSYLREIEEKLVEEEYRMSRESYQELEQFIRSRRDQLFEKSLSLLNDMVKHIVDIELEDFELHNFWKAFNEDERGAAVYYFLHKTKGIFVFVIQGKSQLFELICLPYEDFSYEGGFHRAIEEVLSFLNEADPKPDDHDKFKNLSIRLYDYLIRTLEDQQLLDAVKRIYFIGDQDLAFFPFETLIDGFFEEVEEKDYDQIEFLISKYKVSYHASIAALYVTNKYPTSVANIHKTIQIVAADVLETGVKTDAGMRLIAEHCEKLIKQSGQEVKTIYIDNPNQTFINELQHYQLIHLIAHSTDHSALVWYRDANNDPHPTTVLLTPEQVTMLDLNAELIMLTTCRAGIGQVVVGESPIALNNAFIMAKVHNVYFTFFQINTYHARKMAFLFLKSLQQGDNYVSALQTAKIKMLESKETAAPQCWASPAFMGNQLGKIRFVSQQPN